MMEYVFFQILRNVSSTGTGAFHQNKVNYSQFMIIQVQFIDALHQN